MEITDLLYSLGSALLALVSWGLAIGIRWLHRRTKSDYLAGALDRLRVAAMAAVGEVSQVYARKIKEGREDGKLTQDERDYAKQAAIDAAKSYIGTKGLNEIGKILGMNVGKGELDTVLGTEIENTLATKLRIKASKLARPSGPTGPTEILNPIGPLSRK